MKHKNTFWPLLLIFGGIILILKAFGLFEEIVLTKYLLATFLGIYAIRIILLKNYTWALLIIAYIITLFENELNIEINNFTLFGGFCILGIALSMLFKKEHKNYIHSKTYFKTNSKEFEPRTFEQTDDTIEAHVSMSSMKKYVNSDNFTTGYFSSDLGELKIYFNQAKLNPEGATIQLRCNMGNLELFIPREWSVRSDISVTLGNVDDERHNFNDTFPPVLNITGSCSLGNIKITYI